MVARVKKTLGAARAGHGGALDPLADGLLVVAVGRATRFLGFALSGKKAYRAVIRFGVQTATDDAEGEVLRRAAPPPDLRGKIEALLPRYTGTIEQRAPDYSALKYRGKKLYEYARAGERPPPKIRAVEIDSLRLLAATDDSATMQIECGGGVYIRALARDWGDALGCGAHLAALTRERASGYRLSEAVDFEEWAATENPAAALLPPDSLVAHLPACRAADSDLTALAQGRTIDAEKLRFDESSNLSSDSESTARVYSESNRFCGVIKIENKSARSSRLLPQTA